MALIKKKPSDKQNSCPNFSGAAGKQTNTHPTISRKGKNNASLANRQFVTTAKLLIFDALPFAAVVQQLFTQVWGLPQLMTHLCLIILKVEGWVNLVDINKVIFVPALQTCENMCECDGWDGSGSARMHLPAA